MLGAAVAVPLALPLSPGLALGTLWFGMVGGGWPDWFDLRSDFRKSLRLRHRGASHGLTFGMAITAGLWFLLDLFAGTSWTVAGYDARLPFSAVLPWTLAFALGFLSHLVSDACTYAGIRPFLPFSQRRVWALPKFLRGQSSGPIDFLARWLAFTLILLGVAAYAWLRLA